MRLIDHHDIYTKSYKDGNHWGPILYDNNGSKRTHYMKLPHLSSILSLTLGPIFFTSTFTSKKLIAFVNVQTRDN